MDDLRLVLAVCGAVLLAAIYLWELRRRRRARARLTDPRLASFGSERSAEQAEWGEATEGVGPVTVRARRPASTAGEQADHGLDDGVPAPRIAAAAREELEPGHRGEARQAAIPDASRATPSAASAAAGRGAVSDQRALSGLKAQRAAPEQLDLAGLELSAAPSVPAPRAAKARKRPRRGAEPDRSRSAEDFVLALTIMAPEGRRFRGGEVHRALEHEGLRHGAFQAFHRHRQGQASETVPVFSVVNVVQPGGFDLETIDELTTPGIALFTQVPGPPDPSGAFDEMLSAAERLTQSLGGRLCDESRSTLTMQSVNLMRERIAEHGRRSLLKV